ncbi:glycoside hydrolase family 32 protein [Guptibacillus hwajinpoensis]|uniref:glycoside hydrolase family 32 protein n=1 Tax=Guptibacillus hwajinpoensis TaxID=208199 RepID=UPI0024B37FF2|nr:glycoside hydrolase family 32 protein [Pseudalkalibacillus hwajinpoensis]
MDVKQVIPRSNYSENHRPQFHFTPESNWMNDPNGMVYFNGEYHLFYQYHPYSSVWGPMHWGHAVSKDLIHWEHLPIALKPDQNGAIFSGSAVVDWDDTTGFFNGQSGLVAIFTHADTYPGSDRPRQRQSLAYSSDNGRSWTLYKGNPVLSEPRILDFRDPKVFWHKETNRWVMVIASGQSISIYTSLNLIDWEFASTFGEKEGSHQGVWECPDLFKLPVDNDPSKHKWVLLVSLGDHPDVDSGSKTQYFIGEFDGKTFRNDHHPDHVCWLDHGRDNYAGVTWSDLPDHDGRRILIGWMSNWRYANETPTEGWRSAMTIPRELVLKSTLAGVQLTQLPVTELKNIKEPLVLVKEQKITSGENVLSGIHENTLEITMDLNPGSSEVVGLKVLKSDNEETVIEYNAKTEMLTFDRTQSGDSSFHASFACKQTIKMNSPHDRLQLTVLIDRSSIEIFGNSGETVVTNLVFPKEDSNGLELYSSDGIFIHSMEINRLKSVWTNP